MAGWKPDYMKALELIRTGVQLPGEKPFVQDEPETLDKQECIDRCLRCPYKECTGHQTCSWRLRGVTREEEKLQKNRRKEEKLKENRQKENRQKKEKPQKNRQKGEKKSTKMDGRKNKGPKYYDPEAIGAVINDPKCYFPVHDVAKRLDVSLATARKYLKIYEEAN